MSLLRPACVLKHDAAKTRRKLDQSSARYITYHRVTSSITVTRKHVWTSNYEIYEVLAWTYSLRVFTVDEELSLFAFDRNYANVSIILYGLYIV